MLSNIYEPKWSWAEMVIGRNSPEPLGYVTAKIILFLPKADTCISHNRGLEKVGVKTGNRSDQENFYLAQP